jgi:hypothetical protein
MRTIRHYFSFPSPTPPWKFGVGVVLLLVVSRQTEINKKRNNNFFFKKNYNRQLSPHYPLFLFSEPIPPPPFPPAHHFLPPRFRISIVCRPCNSPGFQLIPQSPISANFQLTAPVSECPHPRPQLMTARPGRQTRPVYHHA